MRERKRDWLSERARGPLARPFLLLGGVAFAGCSLVYASELNDARSLPEVGASDAATLPEGSTLDAAQEDAEAGGTDRGCASYVPAPKHCRDFDDGAPLESAGWYMDLSRPGASQLLELDTTAHSPPRALHAALRNAATCSYTRLVRTFEDTGTERLEVNVRLRPSEPWGDADGTLIVHINDDSDQRCHFILYLQDADRDQRLDSALVNKQQDGDDIRPLQGFAPADEWTDFGIVVNPAAKGGVSVDFSFRREDGSLTETTHSYPTCKLGGTVTVKAGFHCEPGTGDMRYDDIRVDWR